MHRGDDLGNIFHRAVDSDGFTYSVGPIVQNRGIVNHLGESGVHHVLHHHRESLVDENLVVNKSCANRLPMPAVLNLGPVEECDGVKG